MKKKFGLYAGLLTAGVMLSACGGASGGSTASSSTSEAGSSSTASEPASDKDSISWMAMLFTAAPPSGDVEAKLEEHTGVDIEMNWIPDASRDERINAALASGTLADIVSLTQISNATVRQALASGMFWDVEPYLKDYPNLANISEERLDSARINGKLYGVPVQKPIARYGFLVRKDWLENLGLEVPKTMDDLKEVAKAFTENDPDGNGVDDTVGFVDRQESYAVAFRSMAVNFGAGNIFAEEDGKIIPSFMQPEFKEAMEWYRDIYKNGWMNSDFAVMPKNDQKDYLVQGRGGITVSGLFDARNYVNAAAGTEEENMEWLLLNDITAGDLPVRALSDTNGGVGGWLAIPKDYVKTEGDLRVVLQFINDLIDEEAYTLMTEGIEDVHYEITDDGAINRIDSDKWTQEVQPYAGSRPSEITHKLKSTDPLLNESTEKIAQNEEFAVINPAQPLESPTFTSQWSTLVTGIEDAYYQYIMGEIEMDGFDAAIETFLQNGGQQIIDEYTESYKTAKE